MTSSIDNFISRYARGCLFVTLLAMAAPLTHEARAQEPGVAGSVQLPQCVTSLVHDVESLKYVPAGLVDPTPEVIPLMHLPRDQCGFVDWSYAIREGLIAPRDSIEMEKSSPGGERFPTKTVIKARLPFIPDVVFPHDTHSRWLKCANCHPGIFKKKADSNPITMVGIWRGQWCGRCHGKVSFPLVSCYRCHNNTPK